MKDLKDIRPFGGLYDKPPREYTKKEAREGFNYLLSEMVPRIIYFKRILIDENVDVEGSPSVVLTNAAEWLISRAKLIRVKSGLPRFLGVTDSETDLDLPTKNACCYFGDMFGDYIFNEIPGLEWRIASDKRDLDYNLPVIHTPHGRCTLEPTGVSIAFVRGTLRKSRPVEPFSEMYERWIRILKGDFSEFMS